ncbi:MAG: hypothetical protein IH599_07580 [Bacteroidales bacterium]|nr:hypothetical protein [Bacteroidales bacterium]
MLYSVYRKATPWQFILVIVGMLALWLPGISAAPATGCHDQGSLICPWITAFNYWGNGIPARILAMLLLLGSGFAFTLSLASNHMIARQTYFPLLILPLFASYSIQLQEFHSAIPALALLVISLHFLLTAYDRADMTKEMFSSAMFISLAAFLHYAAILFILLPFFSLLIYRNFDWRQWAAAMGGVLTPFIYLFSLAWFMHGDQYINEYLLSVTPRLTIQLPDSHWTVYFFWGIQALILLRALASVIWHAQERVISFRKRNLIMLWFLLLSQGSLLLAGPGILLHSIIIFVPISFYLTYFFFDRNIRRKWQADMLIYLLLLSLFLTIAQQSLAID